MQNQDGFLLSFLKIQAVELGRFAKPLNPYRIFFGGNDLKTTIRLLRPLHQTNGIGAVQGRAIHVWEVLY